MLASLALIGLSWLPPLGGSTAGSPDDVVRAAIVAAVQQRMGATTEVTVDDLHVTGAITSAGVQAIPDPSARLGEPMRFTLRPLGSATATVRVIVDHVHAVAARERGAELGESDIVSARHEITGGPLRSLPTLADAVHARVLRALAPDQCIVRGAITALPLIRTGQDVVAVANVSGVRATAQMVAAGSGDAGAVIRVVNRQSRRALKARVVSPGIVEIIQ